MSNSTQPFAGKTLLITRQQAKAETLAQKIKKLGGYPLILPTIAIETKVLSQYEKDQARNISRFDWLTFTSANGVNGFWKNFYNEWQQLSIEERPKIAALGQKTQAEVEQNLGSVDFTPKEQNGSGLSKELPSPQNAKVLWPCGNLAGKELSEGLQMRQAEVYSLVVYETRTQSIERLTFSNTLQHKPDVILFTSPSGIKGFFDNLRQYELHLSNPIFACIGPTTAEELKNHGYTPHVIPNKQTMEGLLSDISEYFKKSKTNNEI